MKYILLTLTLVSLISCNSKGYNFNKEKTSLIWTAYKTTDKIPVKGTFSNYEVDYKENSISIGQLLESIKFKILVPSIDTKNVPRDKLIKEFFFGKMINTDTIRGEFTSYEDIFKTGKIKLSMNGVEKKIDVNLKVDKLNIKMEMVIDLEDFNAIEAIESISSICPHAGEDGISKTWSDVKVEIETTLDHK